MSITVSVGVTIVRQDDTIQSIVDRVDHLTYESKINGKTA